ncbi:pyridoxine 5'-phosphate synthase [Salegentibacter echinorum]|uniref:Pyridoxine 5'-phosphate synthase n=1 Tax=Salegentibacter echinorum TaxID=1073325 RepID=A0A1M5H841_SALEC|nr:pyridoxine 5'-phosphate synthase [Salegentibacter echinorum]SHG12124.1 pyridoxine 5'-phosphate synthase [Salegentibacter echinorum]
MTKLSVNINKIATLRNARGGDIPNVVEAAQKIESFGGQGITVHPRPDERHITYKDVRDLAPLLKTEFNIEGNPIAKFINLVLEVKPAQVTLVPDAEDAITSNAGWDTVKNKEFLQDVIKEFKQHGIRTSIFVDPDEEMVKAALETGTDRIELYTESYAVAYANSDKKGVEPYNRCAELAHTLGLGINAGHDLSLDNIHYFQKKVPHLDEVSIGHALIAEALYLGLEDTIKKYRDLLN